MTQFDRGDGFRGAVTAKVEPSTLRQLDLHGIFMEVNDHFVIADNIEEMLGSDAAVDILEGQWVTSIKRSEWIIDQIMALKERQK